MSEPSVFLLHGNDEFAIARRLVAMRARLDTATREMNFSRMDGRALDFESLHAALNAVPFLAARRLLILDHPSSQPKDRLLELLEHCPPTSEVALVETVPLKPNHWLMRWAHKSKVNVEVYLLPRRWEMPHWIEEEVKRQGGKIEAAAALRLAEMIGEDTRQAAQEIAKLLTYVDWQRTITLADVERLAVLVAHSSVFDFVDALSTGQCRQAQHILHRLLEEDDPLAVWGMIIRQFRLLLLTREILEEGGGQSQVQKELLLHEFVAQKMTAQARLLAINDLESIYRTLLKIDEDAKTGQMPLEVALDMLIAQLAEGTGPTPRAAADRHPAVRR